MRPLLALALAVAPLRAQPPTPPPTWADSLRAALAPLFHVKPDTVVRVDTLVRVDTVTLVRVDTVPASPMTKPPVQPPPVVTPPPPAPAPAPAPPPVIPPASGPALAKYLGDFRTFADKHWKADSSDYLTNDYYDGTAMYYRAALRPELRADSAEYVRRGTALALDYRTRYLFSGGCGASPQWSLLEGLVMHYQATGDTLSRRAVRCTADKLWLANKVNSGGNYMTGFSGEGRIVIRVGLAQLYAWQTAATAADTAKYAARVDTAITLALALQAADGSFPSNAFCHGTAPYMAAMVASGLIDYYEQYRPDPRIPPAVQRAADWLLTQVRPDGSTNYVSVDCTSKNVGSMSASPDLDQFYPFPLQWVANRTGDARYSAAAAALFADGVARAYLTGDKQFVQAYAYGWRYLGIR